MGGRIEETANFSTHDDMGLLIVTHEYVGKGVMAFSFSYVLRDVRHRRLDLSVRLDRVKCGS